MRPMALLFLCAHFPKRIVVHVSREYDVEPAEPHVLALVLPHRPLRLEHLARRRHAHARAVEVVDMKSVTTFQNAAFVFYRF